MVREGGGDAATGTTLYIDGEPVDLEPGHRAVLQFRDTPTVTSTTFRINRATDLTRFFTGTMDELVLYDRALTAEEVCDHFSALDLCARRMLTVTRSWMSTTCWRC